MAIKGNKGEWSEPYAILKLISEKKLHLGSYDLEKITDYFIPIIRVIKNEKDRQIDFSYENDIVVINNQIEIFRKNISEFVKYAKLCFDEIKKGKGSFSIPEIEKFLNIISIQNIKEKPSNKSDIVIEILDQSNFITVPLGFSIKSKLGSPSTLVNASGATNFIFKLSGETINEDVVNKFNNTDKFSDKFNLLDNNFIKVSYYKMDNKVFKSNVEIYGKDFDLVLGEMLLLYYKNDISKNNRVSNFIQTIKNSNPINYDLETNSERYSFLMKHFLYDYALGMRASEVWQQNYQASGGYLVVKKDGDVICYHFYFKNEFQKYLLENTQLDTGSTSRHKFGFIYKEGKEYFLKLNLQIRFI